MVDEDSHSTDLSVSGEEGYSTILLVRYIFWFFLEDKVTYHCWLLRKIVQTCKEIVLLLYNLHILASDQRRFLFLRATFVTKSNF